MRTVTVVATLDRPPRAEELRSLAADWLEIRADRCGDLDAGELRCSFGGKLLYALPRNGHQPAERRERLLRAARVFDLIDLTTDDIDLFDRIPPEQRVLSYHARAPVGPALAVQWKRMRDHAATLYRITAPASVPGEDLVPLELLDSIRRDDVVAYATGSIGMWTRVVAPHLGAPCVFGGLESSLQTDGTPAVSQLVSDYGFPRVPPAKVLFAIAGDPVYRSLAPRMNNAAFRELGVEALYVPFHVKNFRPFWENVVTPRRLDVVGLPLHAICVVSPHKEIALSAVKSMSHMVRRARSTNFFIREGDEWTADTTDPDGVMLTLRERGVTVEKKKVAVIGCGGSGRAVAAALQQAGADVTLVNRGFDRGSLAMYLLRLPFLPLAGFSAANYAVVVNATPVGGDGDGPPFSAEELGRDAVVVDLVYGAGPTPLVTGRRAAGQIAIDGRDVLVTQMRSQFRLITGQELPLSVARDVAGILAGTAAVEV